MKLALSVAIGFLLTMVVAAIAYAFSGAFDVAATAQDSPAISWLLVTTRYRSVEARVAQIREPTDIADVLKVWDGAVRYKDDCQPCHGAPGSYPGPMGRGMNPQPPKLFAADPARPSDPKYYYWVIMHGIRMTGMPSWQHKYRDQDAWALVAFLLQFPRMSPQIYEKLTVVWFPDANDRVSAGNRPRAVLISKSIVTPLHPALEALRY